MKWGIIGAGYIANRFAETIISHPDCELYAISCRSEEKGKAFQKKHPCEVVYHGENAYEDLMNDSKVEAVYIAVPHGLHFRYSAYALKKNIAVLCEKPAMLDQNEMIEIKDLAQKHQTLFMEGMKCRFEPAYLYAKKMILEGKIGELLKVEACFGGIMPEEKIANTYLSQPGQGGMLLDSGCYSCSYIDDFMTGPVKVIKVRANLENGLDTYVKAGFSSSDMTGSIETGWDRAMNNVAAIYGSKGKITLSPSHRPDTITIEMHDGQKKTLHFPYEIDDFYGELDEFVRLFKEGKIQSETASHASSIHVASIMDEIREHFVIKEEELNILIRQEETLQYPSFSNADALKLLNKIVSIAEDNGHKVAVRIVREEDGLLLCQHLMDTKSEKNIMIMEAKRQMSLICGHSSLYAYVENILFDKWQKCVNNFPETVVGAGAFPIRISNKLYATVAVSGIHEGRDHDIIVQALSEILNVDAEAFPSVIL